MCVLLSIWFFFIVTNFQILVYRGMKVPFYLKLKSLSKVGPKHTTRNTSSPLQTIKTHKKCANHENFNLSSVIWSYLAYF